MDKKYNSINYSYPITLQFFDKNGQVKVVLLKKRHIEYLMRCDQEQMLEDFVTKVNWRLDNEEDE